MLCGCAQNRASDVEVDVSNRSVKLSGNIYGCDVSFPFAVNENDVKADFIKRTKRLKLTLPLLPSSSS